MVITIASANNKISLLQGYMLILIAIGILNHVIIIPLLLTVSHRDSWVSVLVVLAISPVWVACLSYIIKDMNGVPLKSWLYRHFGRLLSCFLLILISVYVFAMGTLCLKDTITWTIASYLPQTPVLALVLAGVICNLFAAKAGLRSIAIVTGILLPFVIIFGDFVMSANFKYKDYSLLFPVMEFGTAPIWKGLFYAAGGLLEMMGILFFQEHLTKRPRFGNLMLVLVLLTGLILGPLTGSIAIFGPNEAAEQRYPAFEQWRMVQLGQYIAHLDFFSIYQWLSGTFIRVTLALFVLVDIWKPNKPLPWLILTAILMTGAVVLPFSDAEFLDFLGKVYFPLSVYVVLGLTALFVTKIWISNRIRR
ncbi:endospore germination permease [Paenibacillus naphthalenovorans]|uniref:Germination protein n=1 Tax=Paenibacillus naphthalenovorans TaxID=162209 RepID=A0A0U2W5Z7_9BACL|nr:endospore germination permease [Paenibacillus naphthalenovorans]ALS22845.1 germination protein [Paenibacillus naphthalenovorans]GCL70638.1 spore gernimation protein [Paenibacillus naphthalenovorans]